MQYLPTSILKVLPLSVAKRLIGRGLSYENGSVRSYIDRLSGRPLESLSEREKALLTLGLLLPAVGNSEHRGFQEPERIFAVYAPHFESSGTLQEICNAIFQPSPKADFWHIVAQATLEEFEPGAEQVVTELFEHSLDALTDREVVKLLSLIKYHFKNLWPLLETYEPREGDESRRIAIANTLRNIGEYHAAKRLLEFQPFGELVEKHNTLSDLLEGELAVYSGDYTLQLNRRSQPITTDARSVLFLLENILPNKVTGYTVRSHHILSALQELRLKAHGVVRPGISVADADSQLYLESDPKLPPNHRGVPLPNFFEAYGKGAAKAVLERRPFVLHAVSNFKQAIVARALSERFHLPWVYELRGLWEDSQVAKGEILESSDRYRYFREQENLSLRQANAVVTLSDTLKDHLVDRGVAVEKIFVVPNGVSPDFLHHVENSRVQNHSGERIFGYFGSFSRYERLDLAIEALTFLPDSYSLRLCGDGEERERLISLTERKALSNRVQFHPPVPPSEIPSVMSDVDALLLLRGDSSALELVPPMKLIEMLCFRVPLVLTRRRIFQEIIPSDHDVHWVDELIAEKVAQSMAMASEDRNETDFDMSTFLWSSACKGYQAAWSYAVNSYEAEEETSAAASN